MARRRYVLKKSKIDDCYADSRVFPGYLCTAGVENLEHAKMEQLQQQLSRLKVKCRS